VNLFFLAQTELVGAAAPDLLPNVWRMLGALAVVLLLLAGAAWLLRRGVLGRRATGGLGVESVLALGERRSLAIVTVEGRRLLVGLAPNNVSLVTELGLALPKPHSGERGTGQSFDAAIATALDRQTS
jgi:flagellar protein FliO/FliZ